MTDNRKIVLNYIGMTLALKNFENDLRIFESTDYRAKRLYIAKAVAVMKQLQQDQEVLRRKHRLYVKVTSKDDGCRVYSWRTQHEQGSIRLTADQLLKLTTKICSLYWVEKPIPFNLDAWF